MNFQEQLRKIKTNIPILADGKYKLPDRRILIKKGITIKLIGHRDKKKLKKLEKLGKGLLLGKLVIKGYAREDIRRLPVDELARLLYPRPTRYFLLSWLMENNSTEAIKIRKMLKQAKKMR